MRAAGLLIVVIVCASAANETPHWHTNVADAFAEARQAHKPVLAVLHCPH